ncbi:Lipid II:glycine glycyltransferase [bioreactor metagenome]|uniref:Lipid II:glycine glycyltransferase n=1 Tax=bioreactor metagenome TaxID=1076179 RepID=A0A645D1N8_9ZZZZ
MVLYEAQLELARKDRFVPKPLSYFESLFDSFGSGAHLYLAKTNLQQAYQNVKAEKKNLEKQLLSALNEHKKNELESSIEALSREISSMEELGYDQQGEKYLGAKLILQLNDKVFNVNMYTTKILPNFRTALALHTKALEDSKIREAKTYDFEGVSGSLDPHDAYYGIYDFKRSFGGDFLEFIGEFDYVFDQQKYQAFRKYDRLYRRFRRKVYLTVKGW